MAISSSVARRPRGRRSTCSRACSSQLSSGCRRGRSPPRPTDVDRVSSAALRQRGLRATAPARRRPAQRIAARSSAPRHPVSSRLHRGASANNTVTFCHRPAGTGKTYLAMAMAVRALQRRDIGRIVLTRPAVEAGENLGFCPARSRRRSTRTCARSTTRLFDMMDAERVHELVERGVIEIAPLAYMRGRTLNDAFVILDEAQNTTPEQMKMFLTRLGFNSKFVITGDATQRDLPGKRARPDRCAASILERRGRTSRSSMLARADVVRHRLVGKIVEAYEAVRRPAPWSRWRDAVQIDTSVPAAPRGRPVDKGRDDGHVRAHQ
ncbi:MAG: PhoH family protein [Collinsella sp.]